MAFDLSHSYLSPEMWLHIVYILPLDDLVSFSHTSKHNYSIMIVDLRKRYCFMLRKTWELYFHLGPAEDIYGKN